MAINEDEKFIYLSDGTPIAKAGISPDAAAKLRGSDPSIDAAPDLDAATIKQRQADLDSRKGTLNALQYGAETLQSPVNALFDASGKIADNASDFAWGVGRGARELGGKILPSFMSPASDDAYQKRADKSGSRAVLTPQAKAELDAINNGQQQSQVPELLARPGTPQGQMQQMMMGSARVQQPPASGGGVPIPMSDNGLAKARRAEGDAITEQYRVGQEKAAAEAGYRDQANQDAQAQEAKRQAFEQRAAQVRDAHMQAFQKATDDLAAVNTKVDPGRLWASKDTPDKLAAAIGIFFGGIGGGSNQALGIVQQAIQDDIAAQRDHVQANLEKGKAKMAGAQTMYGMALQSLGDERAAYAATSAAAKQMLLDRIDQLDAKYRSPELKAKADQARAQISADIAKDKTEAQRWAADMGVKRAQLDMQRAELALKAGALGAKGAGHELPATEAANLAQLQTAKGMLTDLSNAWNKKTGTFSFITKFVPGFDANRYGNDKLAAAQVIGSIFEGGKLTDSDLKDKYMQLMPDASDSEETKNQKLQTLNSMLQKSYEGRRQGFESGGYNVSGFASGKAPATFRPD
jgi:hypothetical protein